MTPKVKNDLNTKHRFLDEAGDTAFFGRHGTPLVGVKENVSLCFLLGMVKIRSDLQLIRDGINQLELEVIKDPYFKGVPSIQKKVKDKGGFYFHATDDPPEVRKMFYDFLRAIDLSFEAVVGRKIPSIFIRKHGKNDAEFYADLLSHLLKNKLQAGDDLILNIAERGNTTKNANLTTALNKATERFQRNNNGGVVMTKVVFNVQNPRTEPLLCLPDYLCWAVQRVFERGEPRYYDFVEDKISLVVDLYDSEHYEESKNYYRKGNPLTTLNKLSPPSY